MDKQNVQAKRLPRRFLGKTEFIIDRSTPEKEAESKKDRHFHQRMLRAYLKGKEVFHFGTHYDVAAKRIVPTPHKVLQEYYEA